MKPFSEAEIDLVHLAVLYGRLRYNMGDHPLYSVFKQDHEDHFKRLVARHFSGGFDVYRRWIWIGEVDDIVQYVMNSTAVPGDSSIPRKVRVTNGTE